MISPHPQLSRYRYGYRHHLQPSQYQYGYHHHLQLTPLSLSSTPLPLSSTPKESLVRLSSYLATLAPKPSHRRKELNSVETISGVHSFGETMSKARDKDFNKVAWLLARHSNESDSKMVMDIANTLFPEKLKLNVLSGLLAAAKTWEELLSFSFGQSRSLKLEFAMGQYRWVSTIKQHNSEYQSEVAPRATYNFINVKLPNDGYVYSNALQASDEELDVSKQEAEMFMQNFVHNLRATKLFKERPIIYTNYEPLNSEFAIYCVNTAERHILTLKFHHGYPVGKVVEGGVKDWAEALKFKYGAPGDDWRDRKSVV